MNGLKLAYYRSYQKTLKVGSDVLFDWKEPEIFSGAGAVKDLAKIIKQKGYAKPLIVTVQRQQPSSTRRCRTW